MGLSISRICTSRTTLARHLLHSVENDNIENLIYYLKALNINKTPNEYLDENRELIAKALYQAIQNSNINPAFLLINQNFNSNYINEDDDSNSLIMVAAKAGNIFIIQKIIAAGADLNYINSNGETALDIAKIHKNKPLSTLLTSTEMKLKNAIFQENIEDLKKQLTRNVNLKYQYNNGDTILHLAVITANLEIIKLLLTKFKQRNINLNTQNQSGNTALSLSRILEKNVITQMLINYGADPNIKGTNSITAKDEILEKLSTLMDNHKAILDRFSAITFKAPQQSSAKPPILDGFKKNTSSSNTSTSRTVHFKDKPGEKLTL